MARDREFVITHACRSGYGIFNSNYVHMWVESSKKWMGRDGRGLTISIHTGVFRARSIIEIGNFGSSTTIQQPIYIWCEHCGLPLDDDGHSHALPAPATPCLGGGRSYNITRLP